MRLTNAHPLRTLLQGFLLTFSAAVATGAPLASPLAVHLTGPAAQDDEEAVDWSALDLEEIADKIKTERDEVDEGVFDHLAGLETRGAMELLLTAYDTFASTYMRREVLLALADYDGVDDSYEPALEKLMNVATGERKRELREAAIRGLGDARVHGRSFLQLIVESTAGDTLRERALDFHIRMGGPEDYEFYDRIYRRTLASVKKMIGEESQKKNRTKREREGTPPPPISWPTGRLRASALGAIIDSLEDDELEKAFEDDKSMMIRRAALQELARRDNGKAADFARAIVDRVDNPGTDRALAARILVDIEGPKAADDLIDIGIKIATPRVFSQEIADMLADLKDEDVEKKLLKILGKGRTPQKAFAIRATKYIEGDKFLKKMRKGLSAKEPELVAATALALAARRDRESIKAMEKLLEKTKSDEVLEALLEALSVLYDGENDWLARLEVYTAHEDDYLRNAALTEIARIGRASSAELMLERLGHPVWSTRLIALRSLAERRDAAFLEPIIAQMQSEVGRMQLEFGDTLFLLTGQPFGRRAATWARWLKDQGGKASLMSEAEVSKLAEKEAQRRLKDISTTDLGREEPLFFGIRIVSERVLFIIDVSGSMAEPLRAKAVGETPPTRMEVAKKELKEAIQSLPEGAIFNIVPFSGSAMSWIEGGAAASETSRMEALLFVSRLDAAGGTNLYESLEFAFDDQDVDTIYLLSDGEPSIGDLVDPQLIRDDIADLNSNRGVQINTIAVGTGLQVLEWLAEDSGGVYIEIQ